MIQYDLDDPEDSVANYLILSLQTEQITPKPLVVDNSSRDCDCENRWIICPEKRGRLRLDGCAGGGRHGGLQPDLPAAAAGAGRGLRPVRALRQGLETRA